MEIREIKAIPLKIYTDDVFKVSYVRVLTEDTLESIKLPTSLENYKLSHLICPNHLLHLELIKTKKNWILKGVNNYKKYCQLINYKDHIRHSEIVSLLLKYIKEDQKVDNILDFLTKELNISNLHTINILEFESKLLKQLGFLPHIPVSEKFAQALHNAKLHNDLVQTN